MLIHHSGKDYDVAASEAAKAARVLMEAKIDKGKLSGANLLEKVLTEVPKDKIVHGKAMGFTPQPYGLTINIPNVDASVPLDENTLTKHSFGQVCSRAELSNKYANYLADNSRWEWGGPLLAHNLNTLYSHGNKRYLTRSYNGVLRGFLSDAYRRLDSRPLIEAFATAAQGLGAVPVEGYGSETKVSLKAMLPLIFEPIPNEVMAFGVMWSNSDYGNGKHELSGFIMRLWCTNYAIMTEEHSQVHLGRRLSEDIQYSQRTYELDTQAQASAINDIVNASLSPEAVENYCNMVKLASEKELGPIHSMASLKAKLSKGELELVTGKFNSLDVQELPPGNTVWRLSNAISWLANTVEDVDRKIDIMKVAGDILGKVA